MLSPTFNCTTPRVPPCEALSTSVGRASELLALYNFDFHRLLSVLFLFSSIPSVRPSQSYSLQLSIRRIQLQKKNFVNYVLGVAVTLSVPHFFDWEAKSCLSNDENSGSVWKHTLCNGTLKEGVCNTSVKWSWFYQFWQKERAWNAITVYQHVHSLSHSVKVTQSS